MLVHGSQPKSYCSNKNMLVCQDHHPLQGSSSSAKIMILCQDHDRLPAICFSQQKLAWRSSTKQMLLRAQKRHADILFLDMCFCLGLTFKQWSVANNQTIYPKTDEYIKFGEINFDKLLAESSYRYVEWEIDFKWNPKYVIV